MPNLPAPARACKRFVPAVEAMERKIALNAPGGTTLQPDPFPPPRPPVLLDPVLEDQIRKEQLDLLHEMFEEEIRNLPRGPLPDFPPPAPTPPPPVAPDGLWETWESLWRWYNEQIGGNNDTIPNPGSLN
jgi:hypothetical protein